MGENGVGKSTFYRTQLTPKDMLFVNADIVTKLFYPHAPKSHSYDAAILAGQLRLQLLREERSFCFETVFSHPSKIDLVFIHLSDVALFNMQNLRSATEQTNYPSIFYQSMRS